MDSNQKFRILVDQREPAKIVKLLRKNENLDVVVQQLEVGDYVISDKIAIERKTGRDLVQSVTGPSRNIFEQLMRLSEAYEEPLVIIENLKSAFKSQMLPQSIYGIITHVAQVNRIPIIPTINIEDTVIAITRIVLRANREEQPLILARSSPKRMTLEERQQYYVEGLFDIGPKKARLLIEHFKSIEGVHAAIKASKIVYTKTGNPKGVDGPLADLKGFGHKFLLKNQKLLTAKRNEIVKPNG
ncbi:MAG: ERCC4 domain-containing protein [Candidatus Helarchaeota archaeon]